VKRKLCFALLLAAAVFILSGCNMRTIDELYCLPKRSKTYTNIQSQIDQNMQGLDYCAPVSGENRQTVQMADLDGDGKVEYIVFAKGGSDKPLKILIFSGSDEQYSLAGVIESTGSAFERVEYVRMNKTGGYELVIGRQVSDQVVRSVSVYSMDSGQIEHLLSANYSNFVCTDLDRDNVSDLMIMRPGATGTINGVAEFYTLAGNSPEKSVEVTMSEPVDQIKRIMVSKLNDGKPAVYVASAVGTNAIITDVFAVVNDEFINVTLSSESGTSVQTLRNYYVFADDIDGDGVLELPSLIPMVLPNDEPPSADHQLVRWYTMDSQGRETNKLYTYHNFVAGWYMHLDVASAQRVVVEQFGNTYTFSIWDDDYENAQKLMVVYVLTGQNREEQAVVNNRIVLHRTDSTIYAVDLEPASANFGITKEGLINSFHLILEDWKTGET